jgi:hypothetical protein
LYSKAESSETKQAFWTAFGQFMALQPVSQSTKISWINYKTNVKHLNFRMNADNSSATVSIEINHPDIGVQALMFAQFEELRRLLELELEEVWDWNLHTVGSDGRTISTIRKKIHGVSIYRKEDWPEIIGFFKPRIMALHEFWKNASDAFDLFM